MLHVKATTNNVITVGECDRFPPNTYCQVSALCFLNRLHHMESNQRAKKTFCDLVELDQQGFNTWVTDALKLVHDLRLDVTNEKNIFSLNCKRAVQNKFITTWSTHLQNTEFYPRLRTYRTIKHVFAMEPYLYLVKKTRYRQAIAEFRCSSHTLQIGRGWHCNPKTPVADKKCSCCDVIEDENTFC